MSFTVDSIICTGAASFGSMTLPANSVLNANVSSSAAITRSKLALESLAFFGVPLTQFRVWDAVNTNLPGTAANDDLGITGGTWGTNAFALTSGDFSGASITRRARVQVWMPENWIAGNNCQFLLYGKISATPQVSATVDVEAYLTDYGGNVSGSDICTTAAVPMSLTSPQTYPFVLDSAGLFVGTMIDIRVTVAGNDTGGSGAIEVLFGGAFLLCDIRG